MLVVFLTLESNDLNTTYRHKSRRRPHAGGEGKAFQEMNGSAAVLSSRSYHGGSFVAYEVSVCVPPSAHLTTLENGEHQPFSVS